MKKIIVSLIALLLLAVAPGVCPAASPSSGDTAVIQGMVLLEQGKADEACALLGSALEAEPGHFGLRVAQARALLAAAKRDEALAAYSALARDYPQETELVLEAARVQYIAGDKTEAMRLGRMVLAEYEKRRLQIHGYARAGVLFDSNANQGASSNFMRLGDWSVEVPGAKKEESFGAYAGMGLDIAYRLDTDSPWRVVGDVGASWQGYENSGLDRNHNREWQWGRAAGVLQIK